MTSTKSLPASLLAAWRDYRAPEPEITPEEIVPVDDVTVLRAFLATGSGGTERATPELRELAVRGLDSMAQRHPERLRKLAADALRSETYTFRAAGVLAEYTRTRR